MAACGSSAAEVTAASEMPLVCIDAVVHLSESDAAAATVNVEAGDAGCPGSPDMIGCRAPEQPGCEKCCVVGSDGQSCAVRGWVQ
jgi:hypothetical protein